ncbi:FAD-dependent oxidoreductase [Paenibacillus alba]|uniref:FAD-dependent oxidoreductase n=1 Tax=Paenibacillus alba TaxID=1197127 RepID=UPI001565F37B|nr:FAD-dependent oxidoreductase [Paenibacillus alba]NQX67024.1 FAD-dependent oxidoreductase [Paenibacillus alba]
MTNQRISTIEADVVVVGAGPAGIHAALAAGRGGAKTVIIERYGFAGGMSTAALVYPWMTFHTTEGKQVIKGTAQEMIERLMAINASPGHVRDTCGFVHTITPYHPEVYKVLAVEMLREAGVRMLFHSFVDSVEVTDDHIQSVTLTSKSGRIELKAKVFVDTTGDADLAYLSGAPCLQGREGDHLTQPMTMKFRMRGVDLDKVKSYILQHPDEFYRKTPIAELPDLYLSAVQGFYKHWKEADLPIKRDQVLFFSGPEEDEVLVNMTRIQGLDGTNVEDLTLAEELGRKQVLMVAEFMTKSLPGFEKASISQVGAQIGIRESRRIEGQYTLEMGDVVEGKRFSDVIARSGYPIDVHAPSDNGVIVSWVGGDGAYDIPYRCLLPKKIDNLLVGGRCISTSHEALGTTRLSPSCMATGQAAGTAAAIAVMHKLTPQDVPISLLQEKLQEQGAILFGDVCDGQHD